METITQSSQAGVLWFEFHVNFNGTTVAQNDKIIWEFQIQRDRVRNRNSKNATQYRPNRHLNNE